MTWQLTPFGVCFGLLLISIGIVVGFDIRFKFGVKSEDLNKKAEEDNSISK